MSPATNTVSPGWGQMEKPDVEARAFRPLSLDLSCGVGARARPGRNHQVQGRPDQRQRGPAQRSGAKGTIEATYDSDAGTLSWSGSYSGLTGPAIAAHFHGPAAAGVNAPPVVPVDASKSPFEGSAKISADVAKEFADGMIYFNVHTAKNKGGETRGQLAKE